MQLPGFLRPDPSQETALPGDRDVRAHRYAMCGCAVGSLFAIIFWFVPIPVAIVVWVLGLKGPFGDYMLMTMPLFLALPLIGAGIGKLTGCRTREWESGQSYSRLDSRASAQQECANREPVCTLGA